jgi:Flp pilus assembly protein TadD
VGKESPPSESANAAEANLPQTATTQELDPSAARSAKRKSQLALDRGDPKRAVEAGEESVRLDPTDAEAWLILGAAYQERGMLAEARRSFSSCSQVAKRGPRGECTALLR